MKIVINGTQYDIINALNTNHYFDTLREAKQIVVDKNFNYSLFADNMDYSIIDNDGKTINMNDYCIKGEIHLLKNNIVVWMCKKTNEELLQELVDNLLG